MEEQICKFCKGYGKSKYFDMKICHETCGDISCNKGFDCKIACGIDLCPECMGVGVKSIDVNIN